MLVKLTLPNGAKFDINPDNISSIRPAVEGLYPKTAKSVVRTDGIDLAVQETAQEIEQILKAIGK